VQGVAVIPGAEAWSEERRHRTLTLADTPVVELPTGSALLRVAAGWELVGAPVVHGDLP
jgi:cyanophycinase